MYHAMPVRAPLALRGIRVYSTVNAMANVAICAARRRGPNNVLIIPQLSQETRPYNSQLLV